MRYSGYRSIEKRIATSDSGGIKERWHYGCTLLTDETKVTENGHLRHGVLAKLIGEARKAGVKINEREIRRRLQAARTYPTEAEIGQALTDFGTWDALLNAGFPQVEVADPGEPYDPRTPAQRQTDAERAADRNAKQAQHPKLFEWDPPEKFHGDEHGPQTTVKELKAACDRSEDYTKRMAVIDARRRSYVDDLAAAVGGDLDKTWYEAEQRRRGLETVGLADWESFDEIMRDFFDLYDGPSPDASDAEPGEDEDE